jgi:hypothetical protein
MAGLSFTWTLQFDAVGWAVCTIADEHGQAEASASDVTGGRNTSCGPSRPWSEARPKPGRNSKLRDRPSGGSSVVTVLTPRYVLSRPPTPAARTARALSSGLAATPSTPLPGRSWTGSTERGQNSVRMPTARSGAAHSRMPMSKLSGRRSSRASGKRPGS